MRTIIAGSRTIADYQDVLDAVATCPWVEQITEVVSGTARGVDKSGERFAREFGIPCKQMPANWDAYGNRAGHFRNALMAQYVCTQPVSEGGLILVWDGASRGSANMLRHAIDFGLRIHDVRVTLREEGMD